MYFKLCIGLQGACRILLHWHHYPISRVLNLYRAPSFHMPTDPSKPLILIGPGTGIAPFRSFWQQRSCHISERNIQAFGKVILLFGCRDPEVDDIYKNETQEAVASGAVSLVITAYSRVIGQPKVMSTMFVCLFATITWCMI